MNDKETLTVEKSTLRALAHRYPDDPGVLQLINAYRHKRDVVDRQHRELEALGAAWAVAILLAEPKIMKVISGALQETINSHGPIHQGYLPSAMKRIYGNLKGLAFQRFGEARKKGMEPEEASYD